MPSGNHSTEDPASSRKMLAYACDVCRRKKRKCLRTQSSEKCDQCIQSSSQCRTTYEPKLRAKRQERPSRKEVVILSSRIQQLEELLQIRSGELAPMEMEPLGASAQVGMTEVQAKDFEYEQSQEVPFFLEQVQDWPMTSSYPTRDSNLIATSLPAVPFATESQLLRQNPEDLFRLNPPAPSPWIRPFTSSGFPSSKEVGPLLKQYLVGFNQAIPLVCPDTLISSFRIVYSEGAMSNVIHQANVWTFLSIAHRLRGMSPFKSGYDDDFAKAYLGQAFNLLSNMLISTPSLLSLQCLVGMVIVIEGLAQQEAAFSLLAAVFRMADTVKPTVKLTEYGSNDFEHFKRMYWTAFFVDSDLCIRRRRRVAHLNHDENLPLPEVQKMQGLGMIRLESFDISRNLYSMKLMLAQIQSRTLRHWLFPQVKHSHFERYVWKKRLLCELSSWREDVFFGLDAELLIRDLHPSDAVHVRVLESGYFNTFVALCQEDEVRERSLGHRILHKVSQREIEYCLADARRLLKMLVFFPDGEHAVLWLLFEALCSATYVILQHVINGPENASDHFDLQSGTQVVELVRELDRKYPDNMISQVLQELEVELGTAQLVVLHKPS